MSFQAELRPVVAEIVRELPPGVAPRTSSEAASFDEATARSAVRIGRTLAAILIAATLAWWPVDWLFFRERLLAVNSVWRVGVVASCGFALVAIPRIPALARNPVPALVGVGMGCVASMAWATSSLGGLELPQFQFIHLATLAVVFYPLRFRSRVVATLAFAATELAAFFLPHPEHALHPFFGPTLSMLATTVALSLALGEIVYRLQRRTFYQERALERRALELDDANAQLETRVREQTAELRRLAASLESSREEERAVIARELHDELGQQLAALRYALALARRRFDRAPSSIDQNLAELASLLDRTAQTTRDVVTRLRPRMLDDLGLAAAVEWQVRRTGGRTAVAVELALACDEARISPELRTAAFRIVQESLTNVEKHARARRCSIALETRDGALAIEIEDDGVGLGEGAAGRGNGLVGMRERAQALGGAFEVGAAPQGGTRVRATLPLAGQARARPETQTDAQTDAQTDTEKQPGAEEAR